MDAHPLASIFPEMPKDDFARLREDIRRRGLQHPITVYEGMILDGRHRYKACCEVGVEPRYLQFIGDGAGEYVIGENLARRHLTPSQIAMVSLNYEAIEREQAKLRMEAGKPSPQVVGGSQRGAAERLGKQFGIGQNTVQRAIKVKKDGVPELSEKVRAGEMTVNEAAKVATLGKASQRRLIAMPAEERRREMPRSVAISKTKRVQAATVTVDPAGTEFTRALLGRLELITNDFASRGLRDQQMIVNTFVNEFGWQDDIQLQQLQHCTAAMRVIADIYEVVMRKAKAA